MKKFIVVFIVVFGLLAALILGLYSFLRPKQIIPNRAAVVGGSASFHLTPGTTTFNPGAANIAIDAFIPSGKSIDGFQIMATVSGTVPSDLAFTPQTPDGMQMLINTLEKTSQAATLKLAFITQVPQNPYSIESTYLGRFTFTAPATGQMVISFDNTFTKIVEHTTSADLAGIPETQTYTFTTATSSPTASPTTSPTAAPTTPPASCTRGNQSVSLSPSSQSGYRGQGLTYTVTVTNNDDSACSKADFNLSAILPYANWTANFAQTTLSISPQSSASTTVIFTSSANSPLGTLPVGVNASGPKSSVVAAANYQVLTPTPKPTAKPTPEIVYVPTTSASPTSTASATPIANIMPISEGQKPAGILTNIPTAVIYGVGAFLLIILFFILRALFSGGNKNNPPKLTPPSQTPIPPTFTPKQQGPSISHSVEPPISQPLS